MALLRKRLVLAEVAAAPMTALMLAGRAQRSEGTLRTQPPWPGLSADTFTGDGLIGGATATEAGCRAPSDGLCVEIGRRRFRQRHAAGGSG